MRELQLPEGFTVTAHAGAMGTPDNSMESLEVGLANADIIEFDLRFTSDGAPVLSHNWPTPKDAVPLEAVFRLLAQHPDKKANVDIKSTDNLSEVQKLAEETGVLDQIFFTGVFPKFVPAVRADAPKIPYYLNCSILPLFKYSHVYAEQLARRAQKAGAIGLNSNYGNATRTIVAAQHRKGLLVSFWTPSTPQKLEKTLHLKPDNITTRTPDVLREMLK